MHSSPTHAPPAVRYLERLLRATGLFVADHHYAVLLATLAFTTIASVKIAFTPQEDDIKNGYTPFGSRSIHEMEVYNEFFAQKGDPIAVFLLATAKDGGSMHRMEYMNEAVSLMDYLYTNSSWRGLSYGQMCTNWCLLNEPLRQFSNGLSLRASNNSLARVRLTFPLMEMMGKQLDLSPNLFGVHRDSTGEVTAVTVVAAQFRADIPPGWNQDDVKTFERSISHFVHNEYQSTLIDAYGLSLTFTADEIVRTGMTIFPFIAVGFCIMTVFSVITVIGSSVYQKEPWLHRVSMAVFGCVCPLLATSSALGVLFWCGFRFGSILCVTPFLILAIGVDDAYLTIQSWSRMRMMPVSHRERVASVLVDVGPSVTITSLTNILAFVVGIYTPTPEIQLFCAANAVAVLFDWVYQLTMYMAVMSIAGQREMAAEEPKALPKSSTGEDNVTTISIHRLSCVPSSSSSEEEGVLSSLLSSYSEWLSSPFTSVLVFVCLCVYWSLSIRGALSIKILLSPEKLLLQDSPMMQMNYLREHFIAPNYTTLTLFVRQPGDLEEAARRKEIKEAIEAFEKYPECIGAPFSHYWMRDYEGFIQAGGNEEQEDDSNSTQGVYTRTAMDAFLHWPEFKHWNAFIKFNGTGKITSFFANVAYHGQELGGFDGHGKLLMRWRDTADKFGHIGLEMFDDNSQFIDQMHTMLSATLSTSVATLACMMVVCFIFMNNVYTVGVASVAIASICIGVFGLLAHWGIDLDPISMATTIMSIGFSVDFPAHVTYHYYREGLHDPLATPSKRIARALVAIGFPLLQCGVSTVLFVCCLLFVKTYMSEVFVKTMFLVVTLGLVHGLMVVPVFLCTASNIYSATRVDSVSESWSLRRLLGWGGVSASSSSNKISTP